MTTFRSISPSDRDRYLWSFLLIALLVTRASTLRGEDSSTPIEEPPSHNAIANPDETNGEERAMMLYQVAELRYDEGRFDEAIVLLREALELSDLCPFHYNLARALQEIGQWEASREEYLAFLECDEDPQLETRVQARIENLERLDQSRGSDEAQGPSPAESDTDVEAESEETLDGEPDDREARRSPWPWVLVNTGVVSLIVGSVFGSLFLAERALVNDPTTAQIDAFQAHERGRSYGIIAMTTLISGGAVALIGMIWGIVDLVSASRDARRTADQRR